MIIYSPAAPSTTLHYFNMDGNTLGGKLSDCKQCSGSIDQRSNCIACEGFCHNVFHAACVKLSDEDLLKYRESTNFWWMCNSCSGLMMKKRNERHMLLEGVNCETNTPKGDEITRIDDDIAKLKQQITAIQQSFANSAVVFSRAEPNMNASSSINSSIVNHAIAESSPVSLPVLDTQVGTKDTDHRSCVGEQRFTNGRFWLFLTRIKNCVHERDILKLVTDSLGTDDVIVKKLVSAWKDPLSMPFISFKIGINVRLKGKALLQSTWPSGLHYREFHDNYWEPL